MPVLISIKPSDTETPPELPLPSIITLPVPFGSKSMFAFDVVTMSEPFISRLPPSCGVSSSEILFNALDVARPATSVLLVTFLSPPPEVSTASNTSSLATVDMADKSPTAFELNWLPSATKILPEVFVPKTTLVLVRTLCISSLPST